MATLPLSELVTDFLEHLEIEQNRSQKTISNYDHYLQRLVEFSDDCDIEKLDAEMVDPVNGETTGAMVLNMAAPPGHY